MPKKINLAVIFGGESREHEISLKSADAVMNVLDKNKYNILPIAITKKGQWLVGRRGETYLKTNLALANKENGVTVAQSQKLLAKTYQEKTVANFMEGEGSGQPIDLVIPLGHGTFMEDGRLQGILDSLHLNYVFSGLTASALAMDKNLTKIMARHSGLTVAADLMIKRGDKINAGQIIKKLGLPTVIKPNQAGSSVGVTIAKNIKELEKGIAAALKLGRQVLLEQHISGRELTCAIFGDKNPRALPVAEIVPKVSGWFDYKAKYAEEGSDEICPARIPKAISQKIQKDSLAIFKAIGCKDLARADYIWSREDNKVYFLEINTIPGMTAQSLAPKIAKAAGLNFKTFIEKLIGQALK